MSQTQQGEGKLGAYQAKGGQAWDAEPDEPVLYLGAAQGTTARWMARQIEAPVTAIEKSPVAALSLVAEAEDVPNLIPFVGDAREPSTYAPIVPKLGLVYQDVAQPDQVDIFLANADRFRPRRGFMALKAASIAVERAPQEVVDEAAARVDEHGHLVDVVRLDPIHRDHAMIVADFGRD